MNIAAASGNVRGKQQSAIGRERQRHLEAVALQQLLGLAAPISRLPEHIRNAETVAAERKAAPIAAPCRDGISSRIEGEALVRLALQIPDPDVTVRRTADIQCHTGAIRRQPRIFIRPSRCFQSLLASLPIHPHQRVAGRLRRETHTRACLHWKWRTLRRSRP